MLETEIKKLTSEIIALRGFLEKNGHATQQVGGFNVVVDNTVPENEVHVKGDADLVVIETAPAEKTEKQETEKVSPQADDVSVEDLQRYCLQVIRNDRSLKDPIKKLVQDMTGAKFMEDVPADKAGELKAAIESLVGGVK